jgi:uncharacterized protein
MNTPLTAEELIAHFSLEPLPLEGGMFRQWYRSSDLLGHGLPARYESSTDPGGKPAGTAIVALLTDDPDSYSAWHRLRTDELWHFYLGDPIELVLLFDDGHSEHRVLGHDLRAGQLLFTAVPHGVWMAARVQPPGQWSLFGNTMAPGFTNADFEGADIDELLGRWPHESELIRALSRPDEPRHMPAGL